MEIGSLRGADVREAFVATESEPVKEPAGNSAAKGNRTPDTRIFSPLLYRLSYSGDKGSYYRGSQKSQVVCYC